MAININNLSGNRPNQLDTNRSAEKGQPGLDKAEAKGSTAAQDSVMLTDEAQQLTRIQQNLLSDPANRSEKVEALKQAVADGSYKVDADQVAKKMGAFEGELNKVF
ncbi:MULTISPECIES: flagellar biosynthesis anti-sigma factor FlgM [Aliagarivorans]|uniref:flagellar biosynthesis anti-sigma factor FlgM n=1 Tax=Aliagarivorans TaxID=882379 RepID=UPI000478BF97|nr:MULTISPECIES: flagellar biosynthesis anti-sigma factor FlgM [Aliagarivorans]